MKEVEEMLAATGNTWISGEELFKQKKRISYDRFKEALENKEVIQRSHRGKKYYSLPRIEKMEKSISKNIVNHANTPNNVPNLSDDEIDSIIAEFENSSEEKMGFRCELHDEQKSAVKMAVNSHICIVTGGPGTGKTTVINAILYAEQHRPGREKRPTISFTAPTGKAARRITESVKVPAQTVQKFIGANDHEDTPFLINCDIVVVDEVSMLDTVTLYQLMRAVSDNTRLFLVGDVDQLPSVGVGSCLRDLIFCGAVPVTKLEKTFRQKEGSCLAENINYIRHGYEKVEKGEDFKVISDFDENKIVDNLVESYLDARKRYGGENVVLLTPFRRKGNTCSNNMNRILQDVINPKIPGKYIDADVSVKADIDDVNNGEDYTQKISFRVGDPVMQLVNRQDCPVANGDVGTIVKIYGDKIIVDYKHYIKGYKPEEYSELSLAYAMSVHKSQGSEYKCVVTCILPEHKRLLNRNMIYTDITRAKQECIFYCKIDTFASALQREGGYERITFLCEEIENAKRRYNLINSSKLY